MQRTAALLQRVAARPSRLSQALKAWVAEDEPIRRVRPQVQCTIRCSFNNTIVTISRMTGEVMASKSGGTQGYKKAARSSGEAAYAAGNAAGEAMTEAGFKSARVHVKGPTRNRQMALRGLVDARVQVTEIKDITPLPYNGCRAKKVRRL